MDDGIFIGICVGSGVLFILIIAVGFKCARKKRKRPPIEFPPPVQNLSPDEEHFLPPAVRPSYINDPDSRYSFASHSGNVYDRMSGDLDLRQGHCSKHDADWQCNYGSLKFPRLTSQSSSVADRTRSAKGPDSDSTFRDFYNSKPLNSWNMHQRIHSEGPKEETASLLSHGSLPLKHVSSASIDRVLLHNIPASPVTRPRPEDDMMLRKMSSPCLKQNRRRSKSVNREFISPSPEYRRNQRKFYRHGVTGNWETAHHNITIHTPVVYRSNEPRPNNSSISQDAPSSVFSTRRHSVKEMVNDIRWRSVNHSTQWDDNGQNESVYMSYPASGNPNVQHLLRKHPVVHRSNFENNHEKKSDITYNNYEHEPRTQLLSHSSNQRAQFLRSTHPRRYSVGNNHINSIPSPPPLPKPPINPYLTPPSPPQLLNTPPPLPSPPKYSCLKSPPPVWTLKYPSFSEAPHAPDTQPIAPHPLSPSTPPLQPTPPNSPMYTPSSPIQSMTKPILMQTNFVPSLPLTPPPVSPTKPTAKPVLLHTPSPPPHPRTPTMSPKPFAKPVLLSSPPSQPLASPTTYPPKPSAKPVLLSSPTSSPEPIISDQLPPPLTPNKPTAKPVLLQSPMTQQQTHKISPRKQLIGSKYDRQSPRRLSLGGNYLPSAPAPPPSPMSEVMPTSTTKPVAKPVLTQPQHSPLPPRPPPPPNPISPPPQKSQFFSRASPVPQPASPTKPYAKPVLLAPQPSPPAPSPEVQPLKYRTRIQVSPRIQAAINSPVTHKTIINISPRRHSIVSERARVFSQEPNKTGNSSQTAPTYFNFPSTTVIQTENSQEYSPSKDKSLVDEKHVRITTNQDCYTETSTVPASPSTEQEVQNFVQDIIHTVSREAILPENTIVTSTDIPDLEPGLNSGPSEFTPMQTSTPHASATGIVQERTDQSLLQSRLWQRRQRMASSDTTMEVPEDSWMSTNSAVANNSLTEEKVGD